MYQTSNAVILYTITRSLPHYFTARLLIDCPYGNRNHGVVNSVVCSASDTNATMQPLYCFSCFSTEILILILWTGENQLDAPDSPMEDGIRTDPDILDGDDGAEPGAGPSRGGFIPGSSATTPTARAAHLRDTLDRGAEKKYGSSSSGASGATAAGGNRPTLPPIYHTVKKIKAE